MWHSLTVGSSGAHISRERRSGPIEASQNLDCLLRSASILNTILRRGVSAMPTYEYRCEKCRKRFSRVETISQHGKKRPKCPKCGSAKVMQVFSLFFAKTGKKS